jgi:hypothetical protein
MAGSFRVIRSKNEPAETSPTPHANYFDRDFPEKRAIFVIAGLVLPILFLAKEERRGCPAQGRT